MNGNIDPADAPRNASPEQVVRAVFDLVAAGRYDEVAAYVDAEDLTVLHRDAERAAQAPPPVPMTAEEHMELEPGLPRLVAEYYASRDQARGWHLDSVLSQTYARVESAADLEGLDTAQLLGRWLEARDPVAMIPQIAAKRRASSPDGLEALRERRTVIGSVLEDDNTAHVLYRTGFASPPPEVPPELRVATLRRTSAGWRMRFSNYGFLSGASWGVSFNPDVPEA